MAIKTSALKNTLATTYGSEAKFGAIYTTEPGSTAGSEPTGGTPAYARKALSWGPATNGVVTATAVFDVPAGATIVGFGVHSDATGGTYLDGGTLTSQSFSSQGTLTVNFSYEQS